MCGGLILFPEGMKNKKDHLLAIPEGMKILLEEQFGIPEGMKFILEAPFAMPLTIKCLLKRLSAIPLCMKNFVELPLYPHDSLKIIIEMPKVDTFQAQITDKGSIVFIYIKYICKK